VTVRLTVQREAWTQHVTSTVRAYSSASVVPVVKGNGYGFGRAELLPIAAELSPWVCVGTVHELAGVPDDVTAVVLTPASAPDIDRSRHARFVATCGHARDMNGLGEGDRVLVKLRSSMARYGAEPDEFADLLAVVERSGAEAIGASIHLPLWVSHLAPHSVDRLADVAGRDIIVRLGTALWHGDKSMLRLGATVVATRPVRAGDRVGYRHAEVAHDGTLVLVGGGTAHGIVALDDGRSPFHFARRRLTLVEPPHMHTSMVLVPHGDPAPAPGDAVDVQRPLTMTQVDLVEWQ
jgi:alanine racemase